VPINFVDLVRAQLCILEELFASATPRKAAKHPGVQRQRVLREVVLNGGVIGWPEQREHLPLLSRALLDSAILVELTGGDMSVLRLGEFANLGDDMVLQKVRTRVPNPAQFEDIFAELSVAAWHQARGHAAQLLELEGLPDIKVHLTGVSAPLYIECKRLGTSAARAIRNDLKDANKKFRRIQEPHFGMVVIDVTQAVTLPETVTDDLPSALHELVDIAQQTLSGPKNRGVARAVLTWDEHIALPTSERPEAMVLRRRRVVIDHTEPERRLPETVPVFEGLTVLGNLNWRDRWLGVRQVALSGAAQAAVSVFGLRPLDLLDAFQQYDKVEAIQCGPTLRMVVFVKRRGEAGERRDLLAWGTVKEKNLIVHGALVLPNALCLEADEWTPTETLHAIVDRHGVDVETPHQRGRLVLYERVPCKLGTLPFVVHDSTEGTSITFVAVQWLEEPGGTVADIAFLFCIRLDLLAGGTEVT